MYGMTGNLGEVYRQTERNRVRQIKRRAVKAINSTVQHAMPIEAELTDGAEPNWYVVIPQAGQDNIAARHLVRRHFGIYLPMITMRRIIKGRSINRKERVFPGYIFAFIWDVDKMYHRVRACPGVQGFLMNANAPAVIPDGFIDRMQAKETVVEGLLGAGSHKRLRKRYRKIAAQLEQEDAAGPVTLRTFDYLKDMDLLDAPQRIGLLHRALGLPS